MGGIGFCVEAHPVTTTPAVLRPGAEDKRRALRRASLATRPCFFPESAVSWADLAVVEDVERPLCVAKYVACELHGEMTEVDRQDQYVLQQYLVMLCRATMHNSATRHFTPQRRGTVQEAARTTM